MLDKRIASHLIFCQNSGQYIIKYELMNGLHKGMKQLQQLKEVLKNYNHTTSWQLICLRELQSIESIIT